MKMLIIGLWLGLTSLLALPAIADNALLHSASPYLAMHGHDPMDWHDIRDREAMQRARREGKPLFVSSGYFACHWCHVMQRETYSDPEVARFVNAHFVPFKVDRELDPAIDARLIRFVEYTQGAAGWPLNVVLTPDGHPFYGFTYLPKDRFLEVMRQLADLWKKDRKEIETLAREADAELLRHLKAGEQPLPGLDRAALRAAFLKAVRETEDRFEGGFGHDLKFPSMPQLEALLILGEEPEFLSTTLDAMQNRNLQDHLHGGFFRYSTDPGWHTPHFEKMLYDNALLARLYLRAGQRHGRPDWTGTGLRTLRFVDDWLRHPQGGYLASLSAVDDQGHEGGFYLWTREQIKAVLSPDERKALRAYWDYTGTPEFDAGNLPPRIDPKRPDADRLRAIYRKLAQHARAQRRLPRDDKRLVGWNALLLSAFAACAEATPFCHRQGSVLLDWLLARIDDRQGLAHALDGKGRRFGTATLADHAWLIAALDAWVKAVPRDGKRVAAARQQLVADTLRRYRRPEGWLATDAPVLPGDLPRRHFPDTVLPSPTAWLYEALAGTDARHLQDLLIFLRNLSLTMPVK